MNAPNNQNRTRIIAAIAGATFLSGCVASHAPINFPDDEARAPLAPQYEGAAGVQPVVQGAYPYPAMMPIAQNYQVPILNIAQTPEVVDLKQRLDRAEQALLRLDRRMQLVERNELGRMGGVSALGGPSLAAQVAPLVNAPAQQTAAYEPSMPTGAVGNGYSEEATLASMAASGQNLYRQGVQPVSSPRDTTIRGSLQASPAPLGSGLPSLADPRNNSQPLPTSASQIAIWTVRYEPEKIWPDRDQLPDSRTVVDALRKGQTITVVARGPNPKSATFQERVRALSRYLAKVAALDTVPISALPTPGLDANTIEILATP